MDVDVEACIPRDLLQRKHVEEFYAKGIVIVPNVLSVKEVAEARVDLHQHLAKYGVNQEDLIHTAHNLRRLSSTRGAGGILDIFYPSWRMQLAEKGSIFSIVRDLWAQTYGNVNDDPLFGHPYGTLNCQRGYIYINRVCYRVPDVISKLHAQNKLRPLQRSLAPHLDCCPTAMYASGKKTPRWRPIQSFVALTPNIEPSTGGFEAVPGFHKQFSSYYGNASGAQKSMSDDAMHGRTEVCLGDYSPLTMKHDREVIDRLEHIPYEAGSLVLWDWRIPHANAYHHTGHAPREVVYTEFLPDVAVNRAYARAQLSRYLDRKLPVDHWQSHVDDAARLSSYEMHRFSPLGSRLFAMCPWE